MANASMSEKEFVTLSEAREQVEIAITRVALLHIAFSKTLVKEFGEEKGRELILKSIMEYGDMVGKRIKRGLPDLPKYGIGQRRGPNGKFYGCTFSRTFQEYEQLDLGHLYCYVDAAKSMAQDPEHKLVHKECAACGDEYCTFQTLVTTEKERNDFTGRKQDWEQVDQRLFRGVRIKRVS
jgi:hypothetical protein